MIVLDESIYDERLVGSISRWYSGAVISVLTLRPTTLIKDEAIPMLLQRGTQPTFLTINVTDFWQVMAPNEDIALLLFLSLKETLCWQVIGYVAAYACPNLVAKQIEWAR